MTALARYERFWTKVDVRAPDECWPWRRAIANTGYGTFHWDARGPISAHVAAWLLVGRPKPPRGFTLDHTCRHRWCVNPNHLQVVTRGQNVLLGEGFAARNARKTHCKRGHPFDGTNTLHIRYLTGPHAGQAGRRCRTCVNAAARARYQKKKREA